MMDLLDLAQMENNTFRIANDNFSLLNVIEDAFRVVQHYADQRKVRIVAPDLPEDKKSFFKSIHGDKNRFQQILVNFLSNSLKFSDEGSKILVNLRILENQFAYGQNQ